MILKNIQAIRGMNDFLPHDTVLCRYIEKVLTTILINYGYNEIRLPILESTQLFKRAIGVVTDVVEKEMYSFDDRNGENITLRPEGTAGCVRACIEHDLFYHCQEHRLWYIGPMFRRERPQKGRFRQFHQLSVETFGYFGPDIDAEVIIMTFRFWKALGISKYLSLELNSIGSLKSRLLYSRELSKFLFKNMDILDEHSRRRLYSNPFRVLDSKDQNTQELLCGAPILAQYLDSKCKIHFNNLCLLLDSMGVPYIVNPRLIRGLDYYNRTVFEWVNNTHLGAQKTICAGGRYDGLVNELGGPSIPAIGCAVGLERLLLLVNLVNSEYYRRISSNMLDIYIAISNVNNYTLALLLSERIRDALPFLRLYVSYNIGDLKKHFKRANKMCSRVVLVLGENFLLNNYITFKDLFSGKQEELLQNVLIERLLSIFKK